MAGEINDAVGTVNPTDLLNQALAQQAIQASQNAQGMNAASAGMDTRFGGPSLAQLQNQNVANTQAGIAQAAQMQAINQQRNEQSVPRAQFGVINGLTGQLENPGTGDILQDAQGNQLASKARLVNMAQQSNAIQGLQPGQQNAAQQQSQMMAGVMHSISNLPPEHQEMAYERAVGVLAGKGVINMDQMPIWSQGGKDLMAAQVNIMNLQNRQQQLLETIKTGGNVQAAAAANKNVDPSQLLGVGGSGGGMNPQAIANAPISSLNPGQLDVRNAQIKAQKDTIGNQVAMGQTGGVGQPVGAPIGARAAALFGATSTAAGKIDQLQSLLNNNPSLNILGARAGASIPGGAKLLNQNQQDFNTLVSSLNDTLDQMKSNGADPNSITKMAKLIPAADDSRQSMMNKLNLFKHEAGVIQTALDPSGHIANQMSGAATAPAPGGIPGHIVQQIPHMTPQVWANIQAARMGGQASQPQAAPYIQPGQAYDLSKL